MLFNLSYMLTYFLTLIFVFLGVYVGTLLGFIAKEELKPGRMYFRALENTLLVFIVLILLYAYGANLYILILLGVAASVFLYYTSESTPINQMAYFLLGIAFFFSTRSTDLFIIISTLIFIYGMPLGSLYVARNPKRSRKTLLTDVLLNFGFFVIIALLTNLVALYIVNW
jgi:hypothetical protein